MTPPARGRVATITRGAANCLRTPWFLIRGDYSVVLGRRPGERRSRFYFSIGQAF